MAGDQSNDYQMLEELGSGSFGVVYKALEKSTGELVAIKHIDLDGTDDDIRDIQQEIALLSTCSSPFVTKYRTSFVRGVKLWIVMEYLGGGSCLDLLKITTFEEHHVAIICRELLLGLHYLHSSGKIHRDIKAANVLLSHTGKVKIADFGVAAQLTNMKSQRMTFVGTPFWMAPEVIQESGYDCKADIWSLGITAMELVRGEPPNADLHPMKALFHIPKSPAPRLEGNKYSRELRSFISCCLIKDPERRPNARDLLNHRFIQKAGKVEKLRELVDARQNQVDRAESHPKYYEETLKNISPSKEEDDWVFDTVKPVSQSWMTVKKRKLSSSAELEPPTEMMMDLDLNKTDLENKPAEQNKEDHGGPIEESAQPIRSVPVETMVRATPRRVSMPTARRISNPVSKTGSPSPRKSSAQKQPLALDTNFGNSASNARPFRRMSNESPTDVEPTNENKPPPVHAVGKEAKLGRRLFSKAIDPALQEMHAQTANKLRQAKLSAVAQAWTALDALDPEGEYLLFKLMADKLQGDSRLAHLLAHTPAAQSQPGTPQKPKLILDQSNPHLKSHRRRQSSQVSFVSAVGDKPAVSALPGAHSAEHTRQLSDALYGRWVEGLKTRWPQK